MSNNAVALLRQQLSSVIVGQSDLIDRLIIALLAGGHVLLEGPPGLAKTTAVHTLASCMSASFQRIQFTPDLMPGDLTGSDIYQQNEGSFRFSPGPLFHQVILADEINRAPPKVQSALLEAMAEHQISVGATTHVLPELFLVLATQNPLEQTGTYPLPEAQLDRFLFKLLIDYPTLDEEIEIARRARAANEGHVEDRAQAVITPEEILALRQQVNQVYIEPSIERYTVQLISATRHLDDFRPGWGQYITAGASPRASIALQRVAMASAMLAGRDYVIPEDVIALVPDILRHRLVLDFSASAEGIDAESIVHTLISSVETP